MALLGGLIIVVFIVLGIGSLCFVIPFASTLGESAADWLEDKIDDRRYRK
jgi:hypothetical protein